MLSKVSARVRRCSTYTQHCHTNNSRGMNINPRRGIFFFCQCENNKYIKMRSGSVSLQHCYTNNLRGRKVKPRRGTLFSSQCEDLQCIRAKRCSISPQRCCALTNSSTGKESEAMKRHIFLLSMRGSLSPASHIRSRCSFAFLLKFMYRSLTWSFPRSRPFSVFHHCP